VLRHALVGKQLSHRVVDVTLAQHCCHSDLRAACAGSPSVSRGDSGCGYRGCDVGGTHPRRHDRQYIPRGSHECRCFVQPTGKHHSVGRVGVSDAVRAGWFVRLDYFESVRPQRHVPGHGRRVHHHRDCDVLPSCHGTAVVSAATGLVGQAVPAPRNLYEGPGSDRGEQREWWTTGLVVVVNEDRARHPAVPHGGGRAPGATFPGQVRAVRARSSLGTLRLTAIAHLRTDRRSRPT
jgi:hypothetical protein